MIHWRSHIKNVYVFIYHLRYDDPALRIDFFRAIKKTIEPTFSPYMNERPGGESEVVGCLPLLGKLGVYLDVPGS